MSSLIIGIAARPSETEGFVIGKVVTGGGFGINNVVVVDLSTSAGTLTNVLGNFEYVRANMNTYYTIETEFRFSKDGYGTVTRPSGITAGATVDLGRITLPRLE